MSLFFPEAWEPFKCSIDYKLIKSLEYDRRKCFRYPLGIDDEEVEKVFTLIKAVINEEERDGVLYKEIRENAHEKFGMPDEDFRKIIDFLGPTSVTGGIGALCYISTILVINRECFFLIGDI